MKAQLDIVQQFCETGFQKGKFITMNFNFPSFKIDEKIFKDAVIEAVEEKVRIGIDSNKYDNKKMMPDVSYDDLVDGQNAKVKSNEQKGMEIFVSKILPTKMQNDESLQALEINKVALNYACVSRMKDSFMELEHLTTSCAIWNESVSTTQNKKSEFVASMIMLKETIPSVYKQLTSSFKDVPSKHLVAELNEMEKNPDLGVVNAIFKIDPKFTEKNFPKEHRTLRENKEVKLSFS